MQQTLSENGFEKFCKKPVKSGFWKRWKLFTVNQNKAATPPPDPIPEHIGNTRGHAMRRRLAILSPILSHKADFPGTHTISGLKCPAW